MICKGAAGMIVLAAFLFAAPAFAQSEIEGGSFHKDISPKDGPAVTLVLDSHLCMTLYGTYGVDSADAVYRTKSEAFEGESESMRVAQCEAGMKNCKSVEGIVTMSRADGEVMEGVIELLSPEYLHQGDAESPQGELRSFKLKRGKDFLRPTCGG